MEVEFVQVIDFIWVTFFIMMKFVYDSLETVKKLKRPDKKQYVTLTIAIFWLVIVAWAYFILTDTVFSSMYKLFYNSMS